MWTRHHRRVAGLGSRRGSAVAAGRDDEDARPAGWRGGRRTDGLACGGSAQFGGDQLGDLDGVEGGTLA
jgi:hypothetical protein